jgi:hypothetical protein
LLNSYIPAQSLSVVGKVGIEFWKNGQKYRFVLT